MNLLVLLLAFVYDFDLALMAIGAGVATLRQQIGQMLIMGFDGESITAQSPVKQWLTSDGLGGVILFDYDMQAQKPGKNIVSQQQLKQLTDDLKTYAMSAPLPLFIAVDYEGGAVDRLRCLDPNRVTLSPKQYAQLPVEQQVVEAQKMADFLNSLGFNLNFAPLLDLNLHEFQGIIGKLGRSFSKDWQTVVQVAQRFVDVLTKNGLICCYKHFPGHGSALGDTHQGFVNVTDTYKPEELAPYRQLVTQSYPAMVMTAHVVNQHLDPSGLPATLSPAILNGLLRNEMGYEGVIISDDLQMNAISKHYSLADSLSLTINAGADMMIFANQLGQIDAKEVIDTVESLVNNGVIDAQRIEQAYQRIKKLKGQA